MAAAFRSSRTGPAAPRRHAPHLPLIPLALVLLILAQGCPRTDDAPAVETLVHREAEAMQEEDLQALAEIWAQDRGILLFTVGASSRAQGWERIARVFKEFFDQVSDLRLTVEDLGVVVDGDLAYATYDWRMTGRAGDYALDDRGHATAVYRREPGGWRLVHAHYSPLHPALAESAASASPAAPGKGPLSAAPGKSPAPAAPGKSPVRTAPPVSPAPAGTPGS